LDIQTFVISGSCLLKNLGLIPLPKAMRHFGRLRFKRVATFDNFISNPLKKNDRV